MNNRRIFLASALSAGVSLPFLSSAASADVSCSPFDQNGVQQCRAGIPSFSIRNAQQECDSWCWAACIQGVFRVWGREVRQREIVARLFSNPDYCATATGAQIIGTINGRWRDRNGQYFNASARPLLDMHMGVWNQNAGAQVAQELAAGFPLINGARGHATVLTAMSYYRDVYGRGLVNEITVRDPWPPARRRSLSAQEAVGTFFIASIRVS